MSKRSSIIFGVVLGLALLLWGAYNVLGIDPFQQARMSATTATQDSKFADSFNEQEVFSLKSGYSSMTPEEQEAYLRLYKAAALHEDAVEFNNADPQWLFDIYARMRVDSPELFYLAQDLPVEQGTVHGMAADSSVIKVELPYLYGKADAERMQEKLDAVVQEVLDSVAGIADPREKVGKLAQFVEERATYGGGEGPSSPSHTAAGALINGQAVCEGYAQALTLLCRKAGIPCRTVLGDIPSTFGNPGASHAWNSVQVGSGWLAMDLTRDDAPDAPDQFLFMTDSQLAELGYQAF